MWCWKSADHRKHKKLLGSTVQRTSTYRQKNLSYRYCAWGPVTQHPHVARPYGAWFDLDELVGTGSTLLLSILKDSPTAHRLTYTTQGKHANMTINRAECICIGCLPFISFFPLIAKTQWQHSGIDLLSSAHTLNCFERDKNGSLHKHKAP